VHRWTKEISTLGLCELRSLLGKDKWG